MIENEKIRYLISTAFVGCILFGVVLIENPISNFLMEWSINSKYFWFTVILEITVIIGLAHFLGYMIGTRLWKPKLSDN